MLRLKAQLALAAFVLGAMSSVASADEMLSRREATALMGRIADLLEATEIVMPELARAGAPLQENFRQGIVTLEEGQSQQHTGVLYRMLTNAKGYLQLTDMLPKPAEFSEDISRQLTELRTEIHLFESHFLATLDDREALALGSDRDNLRRYREENSRVGPTQAGRGRVVFFGDSITDGWRLNQFFIGKTYINRGISGQITGQMLGRVKPDVIDLDAQVMLLLGGTNDLARGVPDATIRHNLESIGTLVAASGAVPVMASILPVSDYAKESGPRFVRTQFRSPDRILGLNKWLKGLCQSKGWIYLNYYDAMSDAASRLSQNLSDDGLHPNEEGYKVMAPLAQAAIDSALSRGLRRRRR